MRARRTVATKRLRLDVLRVALVALMSCIALVATQGAPPDAQAQQVHPAQQVRPAQFVPWQFRVEAAIPFRDVDGNGINDYSPVFQVRTNGTNRWCPPHALQNRPVTTVKRLLPSQDTYVSELVAVGRVGGTQPGGCARVTEFPVTVNSFASGIKLHLVTSEMVTTSTSSPIARATYVDRRTTFSSNLSIDGFTASQRRTRFTVRYRVASGSHGACRLHSSQDHETYEVSSDGTVRRRSGRAPLIDDLPRSSEGPCAYEVVWGDVPGFITPTTATVREGDSAVSRTYVRKSAATKFAPEPVIVVPFVDYDDDGAHDYAGASLVVTYRAQSGEPDGCSRGDVEHTYEVAAPLAPGEDRTRPNGAPYQLFNRATMVASSTNSMLINSPTNSEHNCVYDVAFADADTPDGSRSAATLAEITGARAVTFDFEIVATDNFAYVAYQTAAQSRSATFSVTTEAAASGETFSADVTASRSSHRGCSGETIAAVTVGADGTGTETVSLVDRPLGHASPDDRCAYEVLWGDDEDGDGTTYERTGDQPDPIDFSVDPSPTLTQTYGRQPSTFDVVLEVLTTTAATVDTDFPVTIEAAEGAPDNCSQIAPQSVRVDAGRMSGQTALNDVIQRPVDAAADCTYDVTWLTPTELTDSDTSAMWAEDPTFAAMRATTLAAGDTARQNRYYPLFGASLEVRTTVNVETDTSFPIGVAPDASAPMGCSTPEPVTAVVRVGRASATANFDGLVARPPGASGDCTYVVTWAANEVGGLEWATDPSHASVTTLSPSAASLVHHYRLAEIIPFSPEVVVSVPQFDGNETDVSLFAGAQFTLTFSRTPNADPGCSAGTPVTVTYTVQPNGTATSDEATSLIDLPARSLVSCVYAFAASQQASSSPASPVAWTLDLIRASPSTISAAEPSAVAIYHVGDITFRPDVTIAVPQVVATIDTAEVNVFADVATSGGATGPLTFELEFAAVSGGASGPDDGCSDPGSTTYTYTVQTDGTVTGTPPTLLDRVVFTSEDGGSQEQLGERCVYEVTFPDDVADADAAGEASWLTRHPDAARTDGETSGTEPAAGTTYEAAEVSSSIDVSVMTPSHTPPPDRAVSVTVSAAADAGAACLVDDLAEPATDRARTKTKLVTLDASGRTATAEQFALVDLPEGATSSTDRCAYDVAWSVTDEPAPDQPGAGEPGAGESGAGEPAIWVWDAGDAGWAASGRLGGAASLAATYIEPVAASFTATLNLIVEPHVAQGTAFTVTVAPNDDSPPGCTEMQMRTLVAPAVEGARDRTHAEEFALDHTLAGVAGHCVYDVIWPDDEDDLQGAPAMLYTPDAAFNPGVTLRRDSPTAANRYADLLMEIPFEATLSVTTAANVAADTVFRVGVARASDAHASCVVLPGAEVVEVTVLAGGASASSTVSLLRRPAGVSTECSYVVAWPDHEHDGANWAGDATFAEGVTLSADEPRAAHRYAANVASFAPSLTFDVPMVDFDGDGRHDYAGARFAVGFAPTGDSVGDANCSAGRSELYQLAANGTVGSVGSFELVGSHGNVPCTYAVAFAPESTSTSAGMLVRDVDEATDDADVSAAMNDAHATYVEAVRRFDATLHLGGTHTVNDDGSLAEVIPAGTEFSIGVQPQQGAPAGCDADPTSSARSVTVVMEKAEPIDQHPFTLLTTNVLSGMVDRTAEGEKCVYDVIWPPSEVGGSSYVRDVTSAFRNTLRAGTAEDRDAIAWYRARSIAATSFDASVEVELTAAVASDTHFAVMVDPPATPADCSVSRDVTVTVTAGQTVGTEPVSHLVLRPHGAEVDCTYDLAWPHGDSDGPTFAEDGAFAASRSDTISADSPIGINRYTQRTAQATGGDGDRPVVPAGGTSGARSGAGSRSGGGGSRSSGGARSGGGSGGGAATGPWVLAASSRAPVSVSLSMPAGGFDIGAAVEVMLSVPGTCGDDLDTFAGVPASIGLVYALGARPGATVDVLGESALRLAAFAERGDQTRECELRITLVSAPAGCTLSNSLTDDAGRGYLEVTSDGSAGGFSQSAALTCDDAPT